MAKVDGVKSVVAADNAAYQHALPENVSALLVDLQKQKQYAAIPSLAPCDAISTPSARSWSLFIIL